MPYWRRVASANEARSPAAPHPEPPAPEDDFGEYPDAQTEELQYMLTYLARTGAVSARELAEAVFGELPDIEEWVHEDYDTRMASIRGEASKAAKAQVEREATLQTPSQAARLKKQLESLKKQGIVCSLGELYSGQDIQYEFDGLTQQDASIRGMVWYTTQDLISAVRGYGLNVGFMAFKDDQSLIAKEVIRVLTEAGISSWWPDDVHTRIFVPIRWDIRMPREPTPQAPVSKMFDA